MKKRLFSVLTFLLFINIFLISSNNIYASEFIRNYNDTIYDLLLINQSPLILKNENITFNITNDIKATYENVSDYKNNVLMDYTFYNDSSKDINETFYLNMKQSESISFKYFDYEKKDFIYLDDKELYNVPDGNYRYIYNTSQYSLDDIKNNYIYNSFLNNETNIYQYTFRLNNVSNDIKYVTYKSNTKVDTKLFGYKYFEFKNSLYNYNFSVNDNTFTVYFINGYLDDFLSFLSFNDVSVIETKTSKFEDFVFYYYDETKGVSKMDYSNAIYKKIDRSFTNCDSLKFFDIYDSLIRFLEFNINVKANSTYDLSIIKPIYPYIESKYDYDNETTYYKYTYSYDNSLFKINKEDVNVKINNDGFIIQSSLNDLSSSFIKLNQNSFSFTTSFNENYYSDNNYGKGIYYVILLIFSIIGFGFLVFFVIGLIIALIAICSNGRRTFNNLSNELKTLKKIYIVEGVVELLLIIECFFNLVMTSFNYLQLILILIILALMLLQFIKYKQKHIAKLVFSILILISTITSFYINEITNLSLVLTIIMYIINLKCIDKYKKIYCDDNKKEIEKEKKIKYYPVNILNNKENVLAKTSFVLLLIIALCIFDFSSLGIILTFLFVFVIFFIINIIIQIHNQKDFSIFSKDLDYEKLKRNVLNKLNDKRINIETKDIYLLRLAEVALCYSLSDFKELINSINNTNNLKIKKCQDLMELNYLLNQEDFISKANELKNKYKPLAKKIDKFVDKWKYVYSNISDDKISQKLPYNTKNEYLNAINLFILINYYANNNEIIKENELYSLFKEKYSNIMLLNDMLEGKDVRLRYKELINNEKTKCKYCNAIIDKFLLKCPYCDNENKED